MIVRDDSTANRAEGRVLVEMKAAMRAFDEARELGALAPKLVPGPETQRVLNSKNRKGEGSEGRVRAGASRLAGVMPRRRSGVGQDASGMGQHASQPCLRLSST